MAHTVDRYDLLVLEIDARDEESVQFCAQLRTVSLVPLLVLVSETARSQGIQALIRRYRRAWSRLQSG
jgi:DNA-binding response OmpR family regulator